MPCCPIGGVGEILILGQDGKGFAKRMFELQQFACYYPPHCCVAVLQLFSLLVVELQVEKATLLKSIAGLSLPSALPVPVGTAELLDVAVEVPSIGSNRVRSTVLEVLNLGRQELVPG